MKNLERIFEEVLKENYSDEPCSECGSLKYSGGYCHYCGYESNGDDDDDDD